MVIVRINADTIGEDSFTYENTPIECNECKEITNYYSIEYDPISLTDEEVEVTRCPHCNAHNSFEFELEEFDEVRMMGRTIDVGDDIEVRPDNM